MKTVEELMLAIAESETKAVGGTVEWLATTSECLGGRLVACVMIEGWSEEIPQDVCVSEGKFRRWISMAVKAHSQQQNRPYNAKRCRRPRNVYQQERLPGFNL